MRNDNWATASDKVHVSSKLPHCPATDFVVANIKKIPTDIKADDEDFIPEYSPGENFARLLANLPDGELSLASGSCEILDCGFCMKLQPGYKAVVSSDIPNLFLNLSESSRFKVTVFNAGKKTVLRHKQIIGKIWVEPVYLFEWNLRGFK